jgi:alkylhydroperoxidase family enzyme
MSNIRAAHKALVERLLEGDGTASRDLRRAAFGDTDLPDPLRALVDKVARSAHAVSDADFAAARASGLSEDEMFEVVICAAVGQATRQYESALSALDAATKEP